MKATEENQLFFCACHGEGLLVSYWNDDDRVFYFSMWGYRYAGKSTWKQRLRHIWNIILNGEPWKDECVLNKEEVEKLSRFLIMQLGREIPKVVLKQQP